MWPLSCPTWMIISLSWNWLASRVSEHSPCNGQASAFQNSKGKYQNYHNPLSFLMKYFDNPPNVIQGLIHSHRLPPTHPWCLVTSMPLGLLLNPSSSSEFELLLPSPKCSLLEAIFSPDMSDCHRFVIRSDFVIESSIVVVIKCMESLSKRHIVSS